MFRDEEEIEEVFFPSSNTSPPRFFLYGSKESMAYRFHVSPMIAHTALGQADSYPRSWL
jgi:hypothetical protein